MTKREVELKKMIERGNTVAVYKVLRCIKATLLNHDTVLTVSAMPTKRNRRDLARTSKLVGLLKAVSLKGFKEFPIYHPTTR